jgi:hypothetical protein
MAKGHWGPGARFRRRRVEIEFGGVDGREVVHVGIGYEIVGTDGAVLQSKGWTWHNPGEHADADRHGRALLGGAHRATAEEAALAHELADLVARKAMAFEGIAKEAPPPEWTVTQPPPAWTPGPDEAPLASRPRRDGGGR